MDVARRAPARRLVLGGSQYPDGFPWQPNIHYVRHVAPHQHASFHCSSPVTLSVTCAPMAAMGWCPPGRLFEAASCGVPTMSDWWEGLDSFFAPGDELLVARTTDDALAALDLGPDRLRRIGQAARLRAHAEHTAMHRAAELVTLLGATRPRIELTA